MSGLEKLLSGGDLRSIGKVDKVRLQIRSQKQFDDLLAHLFHQNRIIVMRAADAIEKITRNRPDYLCNHTRELLDLTDAAINKELKWHLALIIPRLFLSPHEFEKAWNTLTKWAKDINNSRIVRVNALEGLFEMTKQNPDSKPDFDLTLMQLQKENIPSIKARIRKFTV